MTNKRLVTTTIPLAVALNVGIGLIVYSLKLPIFLDSIGTIVGTLLLGWKRGAIIGVLSFAVMSITLFPPALWFSGTQLAIALITHFLASKGRFSSVFSSFSSGLVMAFITALVSAPVIYYLFGGVTGNGISAFTIFLESTGISKANSVLVSGFTTEFIDKTLQCLISFYLISSVPQSLLNEYSNALLHENNLV